MRGSCLKRRSDGLKSPMGVEPAPFRALNSLWSAPVQSELPLESAQQSWSGTRAATLEPCMTQQPRSTTSTLSSQPVVSAHDSGRSRAQRPPSFCTTSPAAARRCCSRRVDRLAPLAGEGRTMVVTGRAHRSAVESQVEGLSDANIVLEADPRDSTVAIALAAAILQASRARRDRRIVRRRPRHQRRARLPSLRRRGGRCGSRRPHRHDRHHAHRAG